MVRISLMSAALSCALVPAAGAAAPEDRDASPPDTAGAEAPKRAFIERSLVLFPEQVGDFVLGKANDYPGDPSSGVGLRYRHTQFPEIRLDLFVYPAGRVDRDAVLAEAMAEVRRSVQNAAAQGAYTDLEFGEETGFDLADVEEDGSLRADPPAGAEAENSGKQEILAGLLDDVPLSAEGKGRRLAMSLRFQGEVQDSLAFVFYRGLYLYKGRVSASPQQVAAENFQRLSHLAMRTLVSAVQVRNAGACANSQIELDIGDGSAAADAERSRQLMAELTRVVRENCDTSLDETVPEGYQALPLQFSAENWK